MMIEIAEFVTGSPRETLEQALRFLQASNTSGLTYGVAAGPAPSQSNDLAISYRKELYDNHGPASTVSLQTRTGAAVLETYLYNAVDLLVLLAARPDWLDALRNLDASTSDPRVWSIFNLDRADIWKDDLRPMRSGEFIAPFRDGFAFFSVDTHGEINVEAESRQLGILIFCLAALRAYRGARIDENFARYAV